MKKCQYRIHLVTYKKENSLPEEWDFHYDTAIEAVEAWERFKDSDGNHHRIVTFMGAAGDMFVKHLFSNRQ
jgi:hypothetical protein